MYAENRVQRARFTTRELRPEYTVCGEIIHAGINIHAGKHECNIKMTLVWLCMCGART